VIKDQGVATLIQPLSESDFRRLQLLFHDLAGLRLDLHSLGLLEQRLQSRLEALGLRDFREYYRVLADEQALVERAHALEQVTPGETYFFRHEPQLRLLSREILPILARQNASTKRLRLWCAGCSSGEEAYTLAMLLLEQETFQGWDILVHGSDLCHGRITRALEGVYDRSALRVTSNRRQHRWFDPRGKKWGVKEEVRRLCDFHTWNLLGESDTTSLGRVDLVMCRNVLIYLEDGARAQALGRLYERLVPGGYLLLGHSEALRNSDGPLELGRLAQDLAYVKPNLPHPRRAP
jgi:chemotaxis protein methyltransferase CheR